MATLITLEGYCSDHQQFEINSKYLTIQVFSAWQNDYVENFTTELKSKVCCDSVVLPFLIVKFGNTEQKITKPNQENMTFADVREYLVATREVSEKKHNEFLNKRNSRNKHVQGSRKK